MTRAIAWLRVAMIDLRGSMGKFVLLIACMALGVAAVGTVGTLRTSIEAAINKDTRAILGGDLEVLSRRADIPDEVRAELTSLGRVSRRVELNTQASVGDRTAILSLRAVDGSFPLVGRVELEGVQDDRLSELLGERDGVFGLLLNRRAALQLGVQPGARIRIGQLETQLRGIVSALPDDAALGFQLGAPALISDQALASAGLRQEGVLNQFRYKLLLTTLTFEEAKKRLDERFPDHDWNIRSPRDATAGVARFIDIFGNFMLLVGLTALVVGGLGVANSVSAYLSARQEVIATMRALGASSRRIVWHFLIQILIFALVGVVLGVAAVVALTALAVPLVSGFTRLDLPLVIEPGIMASAAGLALTTSLTFAWLPLLRSQDARPAQLFRSVGSGTIGAGDIRSILRLRKLLPVAAGVMIMAALTFGIVNDAVLVAAYFAGVLLALVLLRVVALGLQMVLRRLPPPRNRLLRFALSAVTRSGGPTGTIVVSLGMGLSMLLLIAATQANIEDQLRGELGSEVPDFVLLDMPRAEFASVGAYMANRPDVLRFTTVPMLRGVITALKGEPPPGSETLPRDVADMFRGDTALTWSADKPSDTVVDTGAWWSPDYAGPPLVSLTTEMRDALDLEIGDRLEITISGRPLELTIASFRIVNWRSPAFNFRIVASPGAIESAPQSYFGTLKVAPGTDRDVEAHLLEAFPSLTFIPVRDAIERARAVLANLSMALGIAGAASLIAGALVLVSALSVGRRQREADAVLMKLLGARRGTVIAAFLLEYAAIGAISASIASGLAVAGAWAVSSWLLGIAFALRADLFAVVALIVIAATAAVGAATTWTAMSRPAGSFIREAAGS